MARWTKPDPAGFPDGGNNLLYCGNSPSTLIDVFGLSWGIWDFVWHFYFGNGAGVTLSQIGLFDAIQGVANQSYTGGADIFGRQIAMKAASLPKPYTGQLIDSFARSYNFSAASYVLEFSTLSGAYYGNMISTPYPSGGGGAYSYSGNAVILFNDVFSDPLTIIEYVYGISNPSDAPDWFLTLGNVGGIPYGVTDHWVQNYSGAGTYE